MQQLKQQTQNYMLLSLLYQLKMIKKTLGTNKSRIWAIRKWYVSNDQNNTDYGEGNENSATVKFKTKVIKSNFCDYSDAYVFATGGDAKT